MKILIAIVLISLSTVTYTQDYSTDSFADSACTDTLNLKLIPKEEAASLLRLEDDMSRQWNRFDIIARLKGKEGSREDLLEFAARQTRDWTEEEKSFLDKSRDTINCIIRKKRLHLSYPKEICMLKTTMLEEDGAGGYTRGNYIVLINKITTAPQSLVNQLVAHESFHILTRSDPEFRKQMYSLIGFHILPREVEFPQELRERIITNPDVIRHDSYATFTINGKKTDCIMVTCTVKPYEGGKVLKYMQTRLVAIDRINCKALEKDGKAVTYCIDDAGDFYDKVGRNTNYTSDPEEILADNFSYLLTNKQELESPHIIRKMETICR